MPDAMPAVDSAPPPSELPMHLSDTGLYADFSAKTVSAGLVQFAPRNVLWSDAAVKLRWIKVPDGKAIDATDMDRWTFPVGTQLWKEFALDGKRLETRLIWRIADTGDREKDVLFGAYIWNDDESDAVFEKDGQENIRGTMHDAPSADTCWKCHIGEPGRVLGFSALQLPSLDGLPLDPPQTGQPYAAPNAALGYLHANCGHCHNPYGNAWSFNDMVLRLNVDEHDAANNGIVNTTFNKPLQSWVGHGYTDRIVPGDADTSAVTYRMSLRTENMQMPPIATELVDETGLNLVRTWIEP
jgi:hypothetical protein